MKKLTIEYIKEQFEKEKYELLSKEYINANSKLKYKCSKGHKHSIAWSNWEGGKRCPHCYGNAKLTIEFIRSEFAKEGYKLLTTVYINSLQKLEYSCSNGHKHSISWGSWHRNHRCPYCVGNAKLTIEFIRSEFAKEGYKLQTAEYKNAHQKLLCECLNGHVYNIDWHHWQSGGCRCPYCSGFFKKNIEFIKEEFYKEGYEALSDRYENAHSYIKYRCPEGHIHQIAWTNWQRGHRCPYCTLIASKSEIEVRNFVESLGLKVSPNNRNQIFNPETGNGFELDIFMPELNKAIEYNGEYWHQNKDRDLLKQELCKMKGINLLMIWDKEWKVSNKKCKEKIMKFIFN